MWGYSGTKQAVTLWPPDLTFLTWTSYFLPLPPQKTKTNLMHLSCSKKIAKLYINVELWQSSVHMTCDFSNRVCLTLTIERWRHAGCPSLVSPALISSPLHLSPPCVHNLITKQGVDSHYGNPGKWPGHFPPYLGSPSGGHTLALAAPLVQSLCVFWWAYAAEMAFTLHWLQWDWRTRLTLFDSTTHFNNVTKQNRVVMLNKTFLRGAQGAVWRS